MKVGRASIIVSFWVLTRGICFTVARKPGTTTNSPSFALSLKGTYEDDWDELQDHDKDSSPQAQRGSWLFGSGREYSLFESRGGAWNDENDFYGDGDEAEDDEDDDDFLMQMERYRERRQGPSDDFGGASYFSRGGPSSSASYRKRWKQQRDRPQNPMPQFMQQVQNWWTTNVSPNIQSLPKIVCRVEPTTTLKLRKTFRPLKTIIRLGADYNTQIGVWQFKSSWEDAIIGGKLTLSGRELQLTKSWQLSVGAVEDLVTRLRFRAAINLQTFQAYARVGFRTERLTPINVVEGFTVLKRVPLDGTGGNVKLEVKANFALPEPEIEYSTETQRSLIGMGDVEVSIDELNLLLDY